MKKLLNSSILIMGLMIGTPAHAVLGVGDIVNAPGHMATSIGQWVDDKIQDVAEGVEWARKKVHDEIVESEWYKQITAMKDAFDQAQELHNEVMGAISDPLGTVVTTVGLDAKKTEQMQYLPEDYTDEQVKNFSAGKSNSDIGRYAQETYDLINEGKNDLFTLNSNSKGQFEKAVPDRDAKEAAYYLAMSEEAYYMASKRYDQINKDYESKIKSATDPKDKENLQMNLQAEQLLLQSQLIQLTALKQTHEARKEVADQRKQVLQKMKKDNRRISVL